jgi:hypothetical protein
MCSHFKCVCLELAQLIFASKMLWSSFFQRTPQIRGAALLAKKRRCRLRGERDYCRAGLSGSIGIIHAHCTFFSLGSWLVVALSTPNGVEGYNSSTDFDPTTISSIQLQCIQAASPHLGDRTTSNPQPKCCMYKSSPYQPPYCTYI